MPFRRRYASRRPGGCSSIACLPAAVSSASRVRQRERAIDGDARTVPTSSKRANSAQAMFG